LNELDAKEKVVWDTVVELADANHIKMPEIWIYVDTDPNAFATWATKNSSLVAVSTGLLTTMNKDEIEWVIGHEMSHILNWDMVTMTLLQWILNTFVIFLSRLIWNLITQVVDEKFSILAYYLSIILLEILFWILASLVVMWFSRHREYKADEWSAKFVWKEKMIAWLKALQKMQNLASADKGSFASMKISTKQKWWIMKYFASHPDLEDRIANLESKSF
jgi:heat shock protein HtpX